MPTDLWTDISGQFAPAFGGNGTTVVSIVELDGTLFALGGEFEVLEGVEVRNAVGALWRSVDGGETWKRHKTGDVDDKDDPWHLVMLSTVELVGSQAVLLGLDLEHPHLSTAAFLSDDFETWHPTTLSATLGVDVAKVSGWARLDGTLLAWVTDGMEGPGGLWAVADGTTWSQVQTTGLPPTLRFARMSAANGKLVLMAPEGGIWSSSDGTTWSTAVLETPPSADVARTDLSSGPQGHVVVGTRPLPFTRDLPESDWLGTWESTDGEEWRLTGEYSGSQNTSSSVLSHSQGYAFLYRPEDGPVLVDVRDGRTTRSALPFTGEFVELAAISDRWVVIGNVDGPGAAQVFISG